jgi:hypothetical protein
MFSSASPGTAWTFTIHATDAGVRQCFSPTRCNSQSRSHAHITHRTSQKAELFCEIRMMREAAFVIARSAMEAYDCWLFPKSPTQPEGELRKTNFSNVIFLTDSLHQFA